MIISFFLVFALFPLRINTSTSKEDRTAQISYPNNALNISYDQLLLRELIEAFVITCYLITSFYSVSDKFCDVNTSHYNVNQLEGGSGDD